MSVVNAIPMLLGGDGYQISRSVRLRKSATAYFNRTFSTPTNNKIWTWSGWVKRGQLGVAQAIIGTTDNNTASANFGVIRFNASDYLEYFEYATGYTLQISSNGVYRDPSAWYHIVIAIDTTQATSANRTKFYVNGTAVSMSLTTSPSQNYNTYINSAVATYQGAYNNSGTGIQTPFDAYLTEVNFIDGQALTPSSFGETDSITGVWKPKKYTGTYGTNGFFLNFSDNSSNTATTIGKDYSGNGNNWTPNNISVTSGATYDSMIDVPTMWADGGSGRGNYCTLNPLNFVSTAPSNGNLRLNLPSGGTVRNHGTVGVLSGKWYFETTITAFNPAPSNGYMFIGVSFTPTPNGTGRYSYIGSNDPSFSGYKNNGTTSSAYGANYTVGDVVGTAFDLDAGTITFYKNGTSQGVAFTGITAGEYFPIILNDGGASNPTTYDINFGQRPFTYTPPTGFKALNTQNLPDATIKKGNAYFDVSLYTGTNATQTVTNAGGFQPDLVWGKSRSQIRNNNLYDSVRGAGNMLLSNGTNAELTGGELSAFTSNGFTLGTNVYQMNPSGDSMVAWQWKESVSAGFDIVSFNTGASGAKTFAHSLGVTPSLIITKDRNNAGGWPVYHASATNQNQYLILNGTNATLSAAGIWGSNLPTSSVFGITSGTTFVANTNAIAYLFAEVAGYSKFGSYTGNGSTDGPFVYLGFRPRFVMVKLTSSAGGNWVIMDSARPTYNKGNSDLLYPNLSNAEAASGSGVEMLSNGFKLNGTYGDVNASGLTYIYAAFAENPFKNSLAR